MRYVILILIILGIQSCLPNRYPPEPVEQERPLFLRLIQPEGIPIDDPDDTSAVLVAKLTQNRGFPTPRDVEIILGFNELMDPNTFTGNVFLVAGNDTIGGAFSLAQTYHFGDTLVYGVRFTPSSVLDPLRSYMLTILGGVKDTAGNSMSIEPGFKITYEFSTVGESPVPRVLIADRTNGQVIAVDTFRTWIFTDALIQPTNFASFQLGQLIVITDEGNTSGFLKFFDPEGVILDSLHLGGRQNGLSAWNDIFVVTTKTPRAYYVVDANTREIIDSGGLTITPKRAAINANYIYILSTVRSVLVIDRNTGNENTFGNALVAPLRSPNMCVDPVTGKVAINDYNGGRILIFTGADTFYVNIQGLHPTDVVFYSSDTLIVSTNEGKLLLIDLANNITNEFTLPDAITSVYAYGDYIYAYLPTLTLNGQTGYLVILNNRGEVIRGINAGSSGAEIFLMQMNR